MIAMQTMAMMLALLLQFAALLLLLLRNVDE